MNSFKPVESEAPKMKVEVWSDIMCPFCYIGKRHYESALGRFDGRDQVEIEWHSYQLDPTIPKFPSKENVYNIWLSGRHSLRSVRQDARKGDRDGEERGPDYRFDRAIVANSFDAHRLIQL